MDRRIYMRWVIFALLFLRLNAAAFWLKPAMKLIPLQDGMSRRQVIFFLIYSLLFVMGMLVVLTGKAHP